VQQDRIVLEKFADYWDKDKVFIDKVTYLPIPDSTVRLANLRSGELDMIERLAATDAASVKSDATLTYADVVGIGYMAMYVNVANGPRADNPFGKDKRLRQAFSLAIDREALSQVVFEGTAMAGNQPYPPTSPWFNKDIPVPTRDIAKAKELMKAAGHEKVDIELQHANSPVVTQMMQVVQSMVAEAGFNVSLKATEFATLLSNRLPAIFSSAARIGRAVSILMATCTSSSPARAASTTPSTATRKSTSSSTRHALPPMKRSASRNTMLPGRSSMTICRSSISAISPGSGPSRKKSRASFRRPTA